MMMCLLHQKKLFLCFLFLFILLGSYMIRSNMKDTLWPKEPVSLNLPSSVTKSVHHTNTSLEELPKFTKPTIKTAKTSVQENHSIIKTAKSIAEEGNSIIKTAKSIAEEGNSIIKTAKSKAEEGNSIIKTTKSVAPKDNSIVQPAKSVAKEDNSIQPDFLGDKYTTDNDLPQTDCPTSIQKKLPMQPVLHGKYLANVPVLQWAKHFSNSEYERLRNYYGAHGWGSVDLNLLQSSLAILNTSANRLMFDDWEKRPNRSKCIRCAVVGNGGILNGSKKGQEIDQNDYVFRTNGAVIKGFEEDVGSRTSFYTFSTNTLQNSVRAYAHLGFKAPPMSKETKYIFLPDHDKDYILMKTAATHTPVETGSKKGVEPKQYFGDDVSVEKLKMYHPDFIRYLRNRFLHSHILNGKYKNIYRPSTGAVMLLAALHTCDEVNAYGFMTMDYKKYSDHYYDKVFHAVQFYANHDLQMELKLWLQLHEAGLIHLYMRR